MRWQRLPETVAVIDKSFVSKPEYLSLIHI